MILPNQRPGWLFFWLLAASYLLLSQFYSYPLQAIHKAAPIVFLTIMSALLFTGRIRVYLGIALSCSVAGDILLASTLENSFIFGLMAFAFAHLSYAGGFLPWFTWSGKNLLTAVPLVLILLSVVITVLPYTGTLTLAVLFYMAIISLMAMLAIFSHGQHGYLTAGVYLFIISDSLIALNKFVVPLPAQHLWVMSTYYLAQYCLFIGCLKQSKTHVIH